MTDTPITDTAQVLDKWADKLADAVSQYGPQATDLALELGRMAAAKELAVASIALIAGIAGVKYLTMPCVNRVKAEFANPTGYKFSSKPKPDISDEVVFPNVMGALFSGIPLGAVVVISVMDLVNPITWVGLWRPEIYLAAKALGL